MSLLESTIFLKECPDIWDVRKLYHPLAKQFLGIKLGTSLKMTRVEEMMLIYEISTYVRKNYKRKTEEDYFEFLASYIGFYNAWKFCKEHELDPLCLSNICFKSCHKAALVQFGFSLPGDEEFYSRNSKKPELDADERLNDPVFAAKVGDSKMEDDWRRGALRTGRDGRWALFILLFLATVAIGGFLIIKLWTIEEAPNFYPLPRDSWGCFQFALSGVGFCGLVALNMTFGVCILSPRDKIRWEYATDWHNGEVFMMLLLAGAVVALALLYYFIVLTEAGVYILIIILFTIGIIRSACGEYR